MSITLLILLALVAAVAFANGANDNCKGVATLVGHGAARPSAALAWAAASTFAGAVVAFFVAGGLVKSFSTGWFMTGTTIGLGFLLSVAAGAAGWVLAATRLGLPVSTTHSLVGALTGAGLVVFGGASVQWAVLGTTLSLPLALGPLLSLATVYAASLPVMWMVRHWAQRCICLSPAGMQPIPVAVAKVQASGAGQPPAIDARVFIDSEAACTPLVERGVAELVLTTSRAANAIHWSSSGLVGFARGWNDTPKIAALGVAGMTLGGVDADTSAVVSFGMVAVVMQLGGLFAGPRVLETLAMKITPLPLGHSLTASLATASLVSLASWNSLPVSTTHVATGAIVGAGLRHDPRAVAWARVRDILLSWVVTLPAAALMAAVVAALFQSA